MVKNDDKNKQFIDDLAGMIAEAMLGKIMDVDTSIKQYIDKHLAQIIDLGIGVERDAWGSPIDKRRYRFAGSNGFIGPLKQFIINLGMKYAETNGIDVVKKLMNERFETMMKLGLSDNALSVFVSAYSDHIRKLYDEHVQATEKAFVTQLETAANDATTRINALVEDRCVALMKSLNDQKTKR